MEIWIRESNDHGTYSVPVFIVGNKIDQDSSRVIHELEA